MHSLLLYFWVYGISLNLVGHFSAWGVGYGMKEDNLTFWESLSGLGVHFQTQQMSRWRHSKTQGEMRICESVRINAREGYGFGIPTIFCSGWHHTWANLKWNNMYFSISLPLKSHISQLLVETVPLTTVSQFSPFFFFYLVLSGCCYFI